jgi:hypothetical protein
MNKEFISYEQALALKELGFDENCLARFDGGGFRMLPTYDPLKNNEIKESWFCVTPLYQQAFRWFREKYFMNNFIYHYKKDDIINFAYNVNDNIFKSDFKTYEEAELKCLKKLIEIVKEKKL